MGTKDTTNTKQIGWVLRRHETLNLFVFIVVFVPIVIAGGAVVDSMALC